jgi:hypothetical protein
MLVSSMVEETEMNIKESTKEVKIKILMAINKDG